MQYKVTIEELLSKDVCVKASSKEEALSMVRKAYKNEEIVLGYESYVGVDFSVSEADKGEDDS